MSRGHPVWGEDKINEELRVKSGISHSTSTIRKYMVRPRSRDDGQKWRTFIKNHSHELFACDFMTQYTALFTTVHIFVVMEISTRRIVLCNVTASPALDWVKIQIRDIAAFDRKPRFLLHDNDGVFGQFGRRRDGLRSPSSEQFNTTIDWQRSSCRPSQVAASDQVRQRLENLAAAEASPARVITRPRLCRPTRTLQIVVLAGLQALSVHSVVARRKYSRTTATRDPPPVACGLDPVGYTQPAREQPTLSLILSRAALPSLSRQTFAGHHTISRRLPMFL